MSVELCLLWNVNMIEWASKRRESRRAGEWIERGVMAYCDGRVPVPVPVCVLESQRLARAAPGS